MVKVPKYFIKEEFLGLYKYVWFCETQKDGYRPAEFFVRPDGSVSDYVLVGAYEMGNLSPGKSISGVAYSDDSKPYNTGYTRAQYRTEAKKNGAGRGFAKGETPVSPFARKNEVFSTLLLPRVSAAWYNYP